jgi:GMP synthase-like glutamine amidotransferase
MNVLLVNNDSDTWEELVAVAKAAGYNVTSIHHGSIGAIDPRGYDIAILSGGWWYDDEVELLRNYAEELQFIKSTPIPIIGICIGMLLMHVSMDQAVPLLDERRHGWAEIDVNIAGRVLFDFPERIKVFKNHDRAVIETDPNFEELAASPGHAEIMLHREKPLLGVQFHPEVGATTEQAVTLLQTLVNALMRVPVKKQ